MQARVSATLCDDIRREDNGKFIIIGGYSGGLGAFEFPVEDTFSCALRGDSLPEDAKEITLTFRHVGFAPEDRSFDIEDLKGDPFFIPIGKVPVKAKSPGDFFIEVSVDGGRKKKIEKLIIFDANESEQALAD